MLTRAILPALVIALASGAACVACASERGTAARDPSAKDDPAAKDVSSAAHPAQASTAATTLVAAAARATPPPAPEAPKLELPRGGREIFPRHRLVGFCGTPGAPALGRLQGNLPKQVKYLRTFLEKYGGDREVLPVFELIAVVVQGAPGPDKKWRRRVPTSTVDDYLRAAREEKALLLLNIQPGHSDFLTELRELEPYLKEPDVGVALDPEWAMKPKQKPGVYYGQTTGAVIDEVARYLSGIVTDNDLPEKVLVYHQVNGYVVKDEEPIEARPGVAIVKSVDGLGPKGPKITTYNYLVKNLRPAVHAGFKLFFDEDSRNGARLMTPTEVLALVPKPEYVMYE